MTRDKFFNTLRLSAKELFLIWKGGLIFLILCIAGILAGFAHSWTVFLEIILFSMFLGVLWFFPFMKKNQLVRGFVVFVTLILLANIFLGDGLLGTLDWLKIASLDRYASNVGKQANATRKIDLPANTPLFTKSSVGGFGKITFNRNTQTKITAVLLGNHIKVNGIIYEEVLFPVKSGGTYISGTFDSTSESWWVDAGALKTPVTPEAAAKKKEEQLLAQGWQKTPTVLYNATVESGGNIKIVGIYFPKTLSPGSSIVFYRFRWEMSFKGREGQFVPDYISSGGEESTVEINSVHCALLAPMDGQPLPKTVWWRPL